MPEVLIKRRQDPQSISHLNRETQLLVAQNISKRNIENLIGEKIDKYRLQNIRSLYHIGPSVFTKPDFKQLNLDLTRIVECFLDNYGYHDSVIKTNLNIEIATHLFFLLFKSSLSLKLKWVWFFKLLAQYHQLIPKSLCVYFFRRTLAGVFVAKRWNRFLVKYNRRNA